MADGRPRPHWARDIPKPLALPANFLVFFSSKILAFGEPSLASLPDTDWGLVH